MLRESAHQSGSTFDLDGLIDGQLGTTGIAHSATLIAFAEAVVGDDDARLDRARKELLQVMGPDALVDASATVASFNSVVRVASCTGIPLDDIDENDGRNQQLFQELGITGLRKT